MLNFPRGSRQQFIIFSFCYTNPMGLFHRLLAILFCLILAGLLVIQRFGVPFFFPKEKQAAVSVERMEGKAAAVSRNGKIRTLTTASIRRGEILLTGDGTYAAFQIGESTRLFLDERTDVKLVNLARGREEIKLIRGRILLWRREMTPMIVATNFTQSFFAKGIATFVNADYKETVQVIPLEETTIAVNVADAQGTVTSVPVEIHEIEPRTIRAFSPSLEAMPAGRFYAWTKIIR